MTKIADHKSMNIFTIVILFLLYGTSSWASTLTSEKELSSLNTQTPKTSREGRINEEMQSFELKEILEDPVRFEKFISDMVASLNIKNREDLKKIIQRSTKDGIFKRFLVDGHLIPEFLFQLIKSPHTITSFLNIFLRKGRLFIYSLLVVLSFILHHYLRKRKYQYRVMSFKRLSYAFFRCSVVNGFRLGAFLFLFSENILPVAQIYLISVNQVKNFYPILFRATTFICDAMGCSL